MFAKRFGEEALADEQPRKTGVALIENQGADWNRTDYIRVQWLHEP